MEHVVDASIAMKWFMPEPHSDKAVELLADFRAGTLQLTAPDHIVAEMANTLWKRSTLRGEISVNEAAESCADFLALGLDLHPAPPLVAAAMKLAAAERHSVYDMLYLALAMRRGCEFITADKKMVNKVSARFPFVRWLGGL